MRNYLDLLRKVIADGVWEEQRNGHCLTIPGEMLKFDLSKGFPAVTTKKLFYQTGVVGELLCFLRGTNSLAEFKAQGCNVWDKNMTDPAWLESPHNERPGDPDYMGDIYGTQWRNFNGEGCDQIANALADIRSAQPSRRIVVTAWNPNAIKCAVLPPCHMMFQLLPHKSTGTLHMTMYQRSCDMFLGIPFNIASYATLLHLFAAWGGYKVGTLTMFLADVHIYENHMDQVKEQLTREPLGLPSLFLNLPKECATMTLEENLYDLERGDIELFGYQHHPAIKAEMNR